MVADVPSAHVLTALPSTQELGTAAGPRGPSVAYVPTAMSSVQSPPWANGVVGPATAVPRLGPTVGLPVVPMARRVPTTTVAMSRPHWADCEVPTAAVGTCVG
jgi:hypothetical protein